MLTPHGALILVVDGGRMQLLRNAGSEVSPNLQLLRERHLRNPGDHILARDAPGRSFQSATPHRSSYQSRDHHEAHKDRFGQDALEEAIAAAGDKTPLVVIAPPHMLGSLRASLKGGRRANIAAEIAKDLSHHSPSEIGEFIHHWRG